MSLEWAMANSGDSTGGSKWQQSCNHDDRTTATLPLRRGRPIVGICGGIASGKSSCVAEVKSLGYTTLNADLIGHETYNPGTDCQKQLILEFGESILSTTNNRFIDRRALGGLVFSDKDKMKKLCDIVWPVLRKRLEEEVEAFLERKPTANSPCPTEVSNGLIIEAAVLVEAGWSDLFDLVIVLEVPPDVAINRLIAFRGLSSRTAEQRIAMQLSEDERRAMANRIDFTSGSKFRFVNGARSKEEVLADVESILETLQGASGNF